MDKAFYLIKKYAFWLFLLLGLVLFYVAYRNIPLREVMQEIRHLDYFWVAMILLPSWGGQFVRAWRWKLLLDSGTTKTRFFAVYHSLLFGYFVNLALPRIGELSRCAALKRLQGPPFAQSLGTVVLERLTDIFFLLLVVITAFILQWTELSHYFTEKIIYPLRAIIYQKQVLLLIVLAFMIVAGVLFFRKRKLLLSWVSSRTVGFSDKFNKGLQSFFNMGAGKVALFFLLSAIIWCGYFFTTWLWFFALPAANGTSVAVAFTVMVVGSLAKTLPIQGGGMGAYHILIGQLLVIYGLGNVSSKTFALLNHGYQTVFYLLFGAFSAFWIIWKAKKQAKMPGTENG